MSLVVCLISKGVETISPKGRIIATILFPLETSIPTAFINLSLLKIIAMDKYQLNHRERAEHKPHISQSGLYFKNKSNLFLWQMQNGVSCFILQVR